MTVLDSVRAVRAIALMLMCGAVLSGCAVKRYALNEAADALAGSGRSFASDNDPELIAQAAPFSLKLMDSLLEENPRHIGLLTAATKGYTQYAFAFVQQEGELLEDSNLARATRRFERARKLYARARAYGLRALDVAYPGMTAALAQQPSEASKRAEKRDVETLYWTAVATGAWLSLSKDSPAAVADVPIVEALIDRALELDESWNDGAIHTFLISFELNRAERKGDPAARAREHFKRAVELTHGQQAAPYVALAESVAVSAQDKSEFTKLLKQATAIDADAVPAWRLENLIMQRRARWLLSRTDQLFSE